MKSIYDQLCIDIAKSVTTSYSTSFSAGIFLLHRTLRSPIYSIYGFVRLADEIVDSFHGFDKPYLLQKFRSDTFEAIEQGISLNPVLHAFQEVVNRYEIHHELISCFLDSMDMDLAPVTYDLQNFEQYILGSAEVVGLMCLKVFVDGDAATYNSLKEPAQALGAAFQKVNFLRDLKADYEHLGRSYFPGIDVDNLTLEDKQAIEHSIAEDFAKAEEGIKRLPRTARLGVSTAYIYYLKLFKKIRSTSAEQILQRRIRIPNYRKLTLLPRAYFHSTFSH
ncbi:MAG: phytoene/squalene synthase family protein [Saprospiraceae bacterium]|nr:phytoene/squalene synthase family protein [Saprospiraceae bacterium]